MAMELIGIEGMEYELKQTYDRRLLEIAMKDFVYYAFGDKRPIPPRGGKSIEFRRFERITITAGSYTLTEGTPPSVTNATISRVQGTINQYGQYAQLTDVLETQSFDPIIAEYTDAFGEAMREGIDTVVRNALSSATTVQYAGAATVVNTSGAGAVGSGLYVNAAELMEFRRTLKRNGARPAEGDKFLCLIHPDNYKDMMEDPDIRDDFRQAADRGAGNPIFKGEIGVWQGIRFIETNQLRIRTSYGMSGADIYEVLMFGKGFFGCSELSAMQARTIIHPRGTGGHTDPLEQYSTVGWKAAFATIILNNDFGGILYCASSRSNAA